VAPKLQALVYKKHLHEQTLFAITQNPSCWKFFSGLIDENEGEEIKGSKMFRNLSKNNEK
jgi:hypothetical protein